MRRFILGTDWWTDSDDVMALRILARKHKSGEIGLLGVIVNACMPDSAASISAFLCSEGLRDIPLGLDADATDFGSRKSMYQPALAKYPHYAENADCMDGIELYRKILSECEEKIEIIEIGYPQVLAGLLMSTADKYSPLDGTELVRQKVSKLWMMAGNWENKTGRENNFIRNERSRKGGSSLCAHWPTEITFLGWEVGNTVITGSRLTDMDDLLHLAMRAIGFEHGRSSWDPMLCLMACIGDEDAAGYKTIHGTASVNPDTGENSFVESENGKHAYVAKKYADSFYSEVIDEIIA